MSQSSFKFGVAPTTATTFASAKKTQSKEQASENDPRAAYSEALVFDDSILKVCVGEDNNGTTAFAVQKTLITSRSEFFKCAVGEAWQSSEESQVTLPEDDPDVFRLYLNLLYSDRLFTKGPNEWAQLCRLYVLAEKLQDTTSKNRIVGGMHAFLKSIIATKSFRPNASQLLPALATKELYQGIPERNKARELIADFYADCGNEIWFRQSQAQLPAEFLCDVACCLLRSHGGSIVMRPLGVYHDFSQVEWTPSQPVPEAIKAAPENLGEVIGKTTENTTQQKKAESNKVQEEKETQKTQEDSGDAVS